MRALQQLQLLLLPLLLLAVVAAQRSPSKGTSLPPGYPRGPCKPGSKAKYECNDCTCDNNGNGYACTRRACFDIINVPERENLDANRRECIPGTTFKAKDGCNDCTCLKNGIPQCTRRACPNIQNPPRQECVPGTRFKAKDGCNDCTCLKNGIPSCSKRACGNRPRPEACIPGSRFKSPDGCNDCVCGDNGVARCTLKACVQPFPTKG